MWSWRQNNWDRLKSIARYYADKPQCGLFAEYCSLQEAGLRKQALNSLAAFISIANQWQPELKNRFVDELMTIHLANPDVHQLITHPLLNGLLLPCLRQWASEHPNDATPHRWLGILLREPSEWDIALRLDPSDQISLCKRAYAYIEGVDFDCHHLSEGIFLGDENHCLDELAKAIECASHIVEAKNKEIVCDQARYFRSLIADWSEYQSLQPDDSFPAWCNSKGREYAWCKAFYYET